MFKELWEKIRNKWTQLIEGGGYSAGEEIERGNLLYVEDNRLFKITKLIDADKSIVIKKAKHSWAMRYLRESRDTSDDRRCRKCDDVATVKEIRRGGLGPCLETIPPDQRID